MLRIIDKDKYYYLSIQDVRYLKPSGSGVNVEVTLKDGGMLKIENTSTKRIDQLLQNQAFVEVKTVWSYTNVR